MKEGIVIKTNGKVEKILVDDLKQMQEVVGGYIECVTAGATADGENWDLWGNEEGRLLALPINIVAMIFVAEMHNMTVDSLLSLHGDFLILGHDGKGATVDCPEEIAEIAMAMAMYDAPSMEVTTVEFDSNDD